MTIKKLSAGNKESTSKRNL